MSANVETMFYVGERNKPWHGLGECVKDAPTPLATENIRNDKFRARK